MASKKISALPGAATPLVGTELVPLVQAGVTSNATITNLTAGRNIPMLAFDAVNSTNAINYSVIENRFHQAALTHGAGLKLQLGDVSEPNKWCSLEAVPLSAYEGAGDMVARTYNGGLFGGLPVETFRFSISSGNTFTNSNLVQGTAAKGVNFTANTPAAGMTSQLLNWYEEGTWTPDQGSGLVVVGAFSSSGKYTRIGRQVTVNGSVNGATSVSVGNGYATICSNLPFGAGLGVGTMYNATANQTGVVLNGGNVLYSSSVMTATTSLVFTITYTL